MIILAGDIGGTKTNLARYEWQGGTLQPLESRTYASRDFLDFHAVLDDFTRDAHTIDAACFGIAGPIVDGRCETTNLPWVIDTRELRMHLKLPRVWLLNDLEATGYGVPALRPEEVHTLQAGESRPGNAVLVAAGTGLGESILFWNGALNIPSPSEGGHCDFAPRNPWEVDLLRFLSAKYGHVSYERILSGPGFLDLYRYLLWQGRIPTPELAEAIEEATDPNAIISGAGLKRSDPVCTEVLDHFVEMYGAEASNLALKALAVGGVYVGGGIAPKILPRILEGGFMRGFLDKGRLQFRELLKRMPVRVILNDETALLGAARYAGLASQTAAAQA